MKSTRRPIRRRWVCSYIDTMHPLTLFKRWFFTKKQAEAWLAKQGRHIARAEIQYVGP